MNIYFLQIIYSADGTIVRGESRRGRGKGRGGVSIEHFNILINIYNL